LKGLSVFRIRIRTKLFAALSVPLAMIIFVATVYVNRSTDDKDKANAAAALAQQQTDIAKAAIGPGSLLNSFLDTRNYYGGWVIGSEKAIPLGETLKDIDPEDNATVDKRIAGAITSFRQNVEGEPKTVQDIYLPVLKDIDATLPTLVAETADAKLHLTRGFNPLAEQLADKLAKQYSVLVSELLDAGTTLTFSVSDSVLRNGAELLDLANRRSDLELQILLASGAAAGVVPSEGGPIQAKENLSETYSAVQSNIAETKVRAVGDYASAAPEDFDQTGKEVVYQAISGAYDSDPNKAITDILNYTKEAAVHGTGPTHNKTEISAAKTLGDRADVLTAAAKVTADKASDDTTNARNLSILGLVAAIMATFLASMSITRPLRKLTQLAEEMAAFKLPNAVQDILNTPLGDDVVMPELDPVYVKTRDEVRDVSAALNVVQESAVGLAVEQAVLRRNIADSFVNLGRRNQNLIGRQLDFITELERNEADPETLENLFKLDHLATRMRRNAESLLVLAGLEQPRQWSAPVDVANIIRAALAEVEGYQRVQQRHLDPAMVAGSAAADLAHVLAELIENALVFSPPESAVEVFGRAGNDVYTLSVVDQGIGMTADQLAEANSRLAGTASFTVAPSRYLGHYVAGHLARRVGVKIDLVNSPSGGVAVRINIPLSLLSTEDDKNKDGKNKKVTAPAPTPVSAPAPVAVPVPAPAPVPVPVAVAAAAAPAPMVEAPAPVAQAPQVAEPVAESSTSGGLKRRVKGASAMNTTPTVINRRAAETADSTEPNRTDVFRFLTGFQGANENTTNNGDPQ
jgi:signal transduction histidine kinase